MDADYFDRLVITLTRARTRRSVLGLLGALGLTALRSEVARATHTPGDCRHNGVRCTAGSQCCSGRCVRERGTNKKFCRKAPGQGICTIESNVCGGALATCGNAPGIGTCGCFVTSRGYSFCGLTDCFACETNADCEQRPDVGQPGDRCIECSTCGTGANSCVRKCPNPA